MSFTGTTNIVFTVFAEVSCRWTNLLALYIAYSNQKSSESRHFLMLYDGLSILYLAVYLWAGWELAKRILPNEDVECTVPLGCAIGIAMLAMLPSAMGLAIGFNRSDAWVCIILVLAAGSAARPKLPAGRHSRAAISHTADVSNTGHHQRKHSEVAANRRLSRQDKFAMIACCVPPLLLTIWLLYTHVLRYDAVTGAYYTGQSGYGDVAMHLAFIKSISVQGVMPPHYPLLARQALFGYPFLSESVSSIFLVLGAGLKFSYILPEIPAMVAIFGFVWLLARRVLGSAGKASTAFILFFFGGGFGFAYFLGSKDRFLKIFTGFYTTPCNDVENNIRWVNAIADLLVPQRATVMGWALAFPCLYLLYRFSIEGERKLWLPLGALAGCLPLMQTHSLLALVIISAVLLAFAVKQAAHEKNPSILLPWLGYASIAGVLCIPQLFSVIFQQTSEGHNFLRLWFNWSNNGTGENYFWFYIKNLGLIYLVQLPAFLCSNQKLKQFYTGGFAVLIVSECVVFQPNVYDNIKLLFFWFLFACLIAANFLWDWISRIRLHGMRTILAVMTAVVCLLSGVLTIGRELVSNYEVFSADAIATGAYVDENTAANALFLTGMEHLNPVSSLAGRDILCGSSAFVYFHGMDYSAQAEAVKQLYETPTEKVLAQWGVDYVLFSNYERNDYSAQENWYAQRYPVWFQAGEYTVYHITG